VARTRVPVRPLYTGLRVRNLDRSIRFYKVLGFRQTIRTRTSLGEAAQLEHPLRRFTIELNRFKPGDWHGSWHYERYRRGSEMDHFGFWVDDVDEWTRRLLRVGGKVRIPPYDTGIVIPPRPVFQGRAAYVADTDGIWIELMGPKQAKSKTCRARPRP
jgi:catechol 2,3-dioxygenase-like lactoylglutathione lyase family enzyme